MRPRVYLFSIFIFLSLLACSESGKKIVELRHFPLDGIMPTQQSASVSFDSLVSSDGRGSIRVDVTDSVIVLLCNLEDIKADNCRLIYKARVRAEQFTGLAFLEMWCYFEDQGEFFARDLATPITCSTDWLTEETSFNLRPGENPDAVRLQLVVSGAGTVWIDDVYLLKEPY